MHSLGPRFSVCIGPGKGKSRIAMLIAVMALLGTNGKITKVTFVYPNTHLKEREEEDYSTVFYKLGLRNQVQWKIQNDFQLERMTELHPKYPKTMTK